VKIFLKTIITTLAMTTCLTASSALLLEKDVIAMVNGIKIKQIDLDRGVKRLFPARYMHQTISDNEMEKFEIEVLDKLIDMHLYIQYAKSINLKISDDTMKKEMKYAKRNFKDDKSFNETLKKLGFTLESFKELVYQKSLYAKLYKEKIEANLTENDLLNYYNENKFKFKEPEKIIAKMIYVRNNPTDPDGSTKAKKRIEEAYEKIKNGEDFGDVAVKYSTAMSRIKGGDLGYVHKGMLEPEVEKKAFSMDSNTTSGIIEEPIGFYIIRVDEKMKANQLSFDRIKNKLESDLKDKTEKERKSEILEKMKLTAVIIK